MAWSTPESREQARAMGTEIFDPEETADWTEEELAEALAGRKAGRWSGLDRYPTTYYKTLQTLDDGLDDNGVADLYFKEPYDVQGLVLLACKLGYDAGRADGRRDREE